MARTFSECTFLPRNITLPSHCQKAGTLCCIEALQCCFLNRERKEFWDSWYFWFIIILFFLLVLTSFISYVAGSCKRKKQNLIRIRNISGSAGSTSISTTASGSDEIIQPRLAYNKKCDSHAMAFITNPEEMIVEDIAGPLSPPYPPIQQVTIVRGSAPPLGFRQTNHYTELVLPPGYVDTNYNKR